MKHYLHFSTALRKLFLVAAIGSSCGCLFAAPHTVARTGNAHNTVPFDRAVFLFTGDAYSRAVAELNISGKVSDEAGEALIGVSVRLKGTSLGTVTDIDGQYAITIPDEKGILVFSYIGFATQEVAVANSQVINVTLIQEASTLGEVVVVAYGTQKKETLTGAVSSIKTEEIRESPAANLAVSLAGRLPGLTAIQRSGEPGRDLTQLFIRGQGTINSQSPLILVDGVERELTYINPNEVESVTILKDASSTALFGVRGANGVILVTTRRGVSEVPEINFTAEAGAQDFTRFIQPVNSYQYASLINLIQRNDGQSEIYSDDALMHYKTGDDPLRYPNTNWRDILIKPYSLQQRYNLNVSGAGKAVKYFINAGYLNQGGQFRIEDNLPYDPSFHLNRYNFRSNIDIQLSKSLKTFLNLAGYVEKENSPVNINELNFSSPALDIIRYSNRLNSSIPGPLAPDGSVMTMPGIVHPSYGQINRSGYMQQTRSNVTATFGVEKSLDAITKGLSIKGVASFDSRAFNTLFARKLYEKSIQIIDPSLSGSDGKDSVYYQPFNADLNTPLTISGANSFISMSNFQGYINYYRDFNKHAVSALMLYQQQRTIINAELPFNLIGSAMRVTYDFDKRYLAEFNAGYNGSEQFSPGNRFGFFPAVSAGWVLSNENFLAGSKILTLLKLRGSYGKVGNDRIGDRRFLYLDDIQIYGGGYSNSLDNGRQVGTALLKNEGITWETATKTDIGLEVGLSNGLDLVVDFFHEKRDNILRNRGTVPVLNGLPISVLPPVNIGKVVNKGYEMELNYKKYYSSELSLMARLNVSYARNKQLFADEPLLPADYAYRYRQTGYRIDQPFGYIVDGYFADTTAIANAPVQVVGGHESRPGDFKYKDLNGDGVVNEKDRAPIGYSNVPEYTFGAAFNVNYKNFDLSFLFHGISNVYNFYEGRGTFAEENFVARHLKSWTPERAASGETIEYPRLTAQVSPNEIANSFFIIDASYLRLKNVELGYTLPAHLSERLGAKQARIYANGLNLITWDRLPTNDFDPELVDKYSYPVLRVVNIGVNVTF